MKKYVLKAMVVAVVLAILGNAVFAAPKAKAKAKPAPVAAPWTAANTGLGMRHIDPIAV